MNFIETNSSLNNYLQQLNKIDKDLLNILEKRKIIIRIIKKLQKKLKKSNLLLNNNIKLTSEEKIIELTKLTKKYKKKQLMDIYNKINEYN